MPDEELNAGISVEWVQTSEDPFIPTNTTDVFAELEPLEDTQSTYYSDDYSNFYPNLLPPLIPSYGDLPEFQDTQKELIINIETTGVLPWASRIICIGVLDPNELEPKVITFLKETETETVIDFIAWLEQQQFSILIGYNVSFDYRFIYACLQKYRFTSAKFMDLKLYDLMQQQKQVKDEFVYGRNKEGTLQNWAEYLLGAAEYAPQKQVFKWLKEKNFDEIENYNADKIVKAYYLWVLDKVVEGSIPGSEVVARFTEPAKETPIGTSNPTQAEKEQGIKVSCPQCFNEQFMPKTEKVINCEVCGTPISNPTI